MLVPQIEPPVAPVQPEELKGYMYLWKEDPIWEKNLFQIKVCILLYGAPRRSESHVLQCGLSHVP